MERERKRKGKEKWNLEALAETEKSQMPQPGIKPGTPANVVDALRLSH